MPRLARVVVAGYRRHITGCGYYRQPTLFRDDHEAYPIPMAEWCAEPAVQV